MNSPDHAHQLVFDDRPARSRASDAANQVETTHALVKRATLRALADALKREYCAGAVRDALLAIADIWPGESPPESSVMARQAKTHIQED